MTQKIGFLSPLATNQADEIVISPAGIPADVLPGSELSGKTLLEQALERVPVRYSEDRSGKLSTVLPGGKRVKALHVSFTIDPSSIFRLGCVVFPAIPPRNALEAMLCCQEYNAHLRFGRLYLHIQERDGQQEKFLCCDAELDLSDGVSVAFLATFIKSILSCACSYISEPDVQKLLFGRGNGKGAGQKPN